MKNETPNFWDGYLRKAPKDYTSPIPSHEIPCCWSDEVYLEKNPDVTNAVKEGHLTSGWFHYKNNGFKEGRAPAWKNPDEFREILLSTFKINYVIATWSGPRRAGNDTYHQDRGFYVKKHLNSLKKYKNSISQITIAVPENPEEPKSFTSAINSVPSKIQNAEVVVTRRPNIGQSYGSYSQIYGQYKDAFTYYFFIEDDYVFVKDDFDLDLIRLLEWKRTRNCGFLCSMVSMYARKPHAAISNGIARSDTLAAVWKKFGCLPHGPKNQDVGYSTSPQLEFGWGFLESGTTLQDYLEYFRAPFNDAGTLKMYGNERNPDLLIPAQFIQELGYNL